MKKCVFFSILAFSLSFVGCVKEQHAEAEPEAEIISEKPQMTVLTANIESDLTKTSQSGIQSILWSAGDALKVHLSDHSFETFSIATGVGEKTATFSTENEVTPEGFAVYPASYAGNYNSSTHVIEMVLPKSYSYSKAVGITPMYAALEDGTLTFRHLCALLRFDVSNLPGNAAKFVFTANKKISGTFSFDVTSGEGYPAICTDDTEDASEKSVTVSFTAGETGFRSFLIPVPDGEYTFSFSIQKEDGTMLYSKQRTTAIKFSKYDYYVMPAISAAFEPTGNLFTGSETGADGSDFSIDKRYGVGSWANLSIGSSIKVTYTTNDTSSNYRYWQLWYKYGDSWTTFASENLAGGSTEHSVLITPEVYALLGTSSGLIISGKHITITSIDVVPASATMVVWTGSHTMSGWSNDFVELTDGVLTALGIRKGSEIRVYGTGSSFELQDRDYGSTQTIHNGSDYKYVVLSDEDATTFKSKGIRIKSDSYVINKITVKR